ncbi:MFS transporter, UMF1 family [Paenibacillus sp. UNCCL117]|uniref:MFS transporter n=1 Tax=unclassified Paenibacillus TaxID=185978 RepID=UPI00088A108F|nr:MULTISPECIES: MFS transporter [unclassified Paenibacillus]SDD41186.1 MFS transporter, UMF1 family [Paenibacillus sp. cl123]SFW47903.1 MFS transporter, UMF1 family [Paenibacillus sp. UNCCL117]
MSLTPRMSERPELPRSGWKLYFALPVLVWALYDFANTIFTSNIVTIFFPFYLQETLGGSETMNQIASTFITYTNALASFFLVLLTPLYGVLIDRTGRKKPFLVPLTLLCIGSTLLMGAASYWQTGLTVAGIPLSLALVLIFFMFAKFFYNSSLVFYDAMISDLGNEKEMPLISGYGVAVGYFGTLVGLSVYPFIGDAGFHRSFIPSALLFLLFSLPLFLGYKESPGRAAAAAAAGGPKPSFFSGYREVWQTFKEARSYRSVFLFMIAYFFFNDAVATAIAVMGVYAKTVIGFSTGQFILLYLVSTVSSIAGSFGFGYITRYAGSKRAVGAVAVVMIASIALASLTASQELFWVAGSLYGISMGAMWVTSRTMIVELTPEEKRGQFFGLFAFSGKVSSIVGPLLYGTITLVLAEHGNLASRAALGSLIVLILIGLAVHSRVPYRNPR